MIQTLLALPLFGADYPGLGVGQGSPTEQAKPFSLPLAACPTNLATLHSFAQYLKQAHAFLLLWRLPYPQLHAYPLPTSLSKKQPCYPLLLYLRTSQTKLPIRALPNSPSEQAYAFIMLGPGCPPNSNPPLPPSYLRTLPGNPPTPQPRTCPTKQATGFFVLACPSKLPLHPNLSASFRLAAGWIKSPFWS